MHQLGSARCALLATAVAACLAPAQLLHAQSGHALPSTYDPNSIRSVQARLAQVRQHTVNMANLYNGGRSIGGSTRYPGQVEASRLDYLRTRAYPNDRIDPAAFMRARSKAALLPPAQIRGRSAGANGLNPALAGLSPWTPVGPAGYAFYGEQSGPITGIAIDPTNPANIYVSATKGGVWNSPDGGVSWNPLTDYEPGLAMSSVAIDYENPQIVYAGTGDYDYGQEPGYGVLKSIDGGQTWNLTGAGQFGTSPVHRIVIDPHTSSKVWACAGTAGLFVSFDTGDTWQPALGPKTTPAVTGSVSNLVYNSDGDILYCAIDGVGVYTSTNGGTTWAVLSGAPSGAGRFDVATSQLANVHPGDWSFIRYKRTVYVVTDGGAGTIAVGAPPPNKPNDPIVWKTRGNFPTPAMLGGEDQFGGKYNLSLTCTWHHIFVDGDPKANPPVPPMDVDMDVLYLGLSGTNSFSGLWQSQDEGQLWQPAQIATNGYHAAVLDPTDHASVYVSGDQGLYHVSYAQNTGQISGIKKHIEPPQPVKDPAPITAPSVVPDYPYWFSPVPYGFFTWTGINAGLQTEEFVNGAFHPTDPTLYLGATATNYNLVSSGGISSWIALGGIGGSGGGCGINQQNGAIEYATGGSGHAGGDPLQPPVYTVQTTADTWGSGSYIGLYVGDDVEPGNIAGAINTVTGAFYMGTNYLYVHEDGTGVQYRKFRQRFAGVGVITAIANAPTNGSVLYVGTSDGALWRTTDPSQNTAKFVRVDLQGQKGGLPNRSITSIAVSPLSDKKVFVTVSGTGTSHALRCDDVTNPNWVSIGGETGSQPLPDIFTSTIAVMPHNNDRELFVGQDIGLFYSSDGGAHWSAVSGSVPNFTLPNADFRTVAYDAGTQSLNAATYGRGMWTMNLAFDIVLAAITVDPNPVVGGVPAVATASLNGLAPTGGTPVKLTSSNPAVASVPASVSIAENTNNITFPVKTFPVSKATNVTITGTAPDSAGVQVTVKYTLTVTPAVLSTLTLDGVTVDSVTGGAVVHGLVALNGPAPKAVTINLSSTYVARAPVPLTVVIPAGKSSASFLINTKPVLIDNPLNRVTITATTSGTTLKAILQLNPPRVKSVTFVSPIVNGGQVALGNVVLDSPAPRGGAQVRLVSANPSIASVPSTVLVPAGALGAPFKVHTNAVTAKTAVGLTAVYNGTAVTTLTINP